MELPAWCRGNLLALHLEDNRLEDLILTDDRTRGKRVRGDRRILNCREILSGDSLQYPSSSRSATARTWRRKHRRQKGFWWLVFPGQVFFGLGPRNKSQESRTKIK